MQQPEVFYVTYIAATPQRVWQAITEPEFTRQYFFGRSIESDWEVGSSWRLPSRGSGPADYGEVLESDPPRLLRITWRGEGMAEYCEVSYRLEDLGGVVRLTVSEAHLDDATADFKRGGHEAWPILLSGLKTLLETGQGLPAFDMK